MLTYRDSMGLTFWVGVCVCVCVGGVALTCTRMRGRWGEGKGTLCIKLEMCLGAEDGKRREMNNTSLNTSQDGI